VSKKIPKSSGFRKPSTRSRLIEILTNPENWDITQVKKAELLGVTDRYVRELESDDSLWEEVFAINKRKSKGKDAAIWKSMCCEAINGSFFQQKLYFEMTGQYKEKKQLEVKNTITIEELEEFAE